MQKGSQRLWPAWILHRGVAGLPRRQFWDERQTLLRPGTGLLLQRPMPHASAALLEAVWTRYATHCCHCGQSSQCTTIPCTQLLCGKLRFFWLDWYKPFQDTNTTAGTIDASVRAQERNYRIEVTRVWSFIVIHWSKPHKNMWNVNFLWYCY